MSSSLTGTPVDFDQLEYRINGAAQSIAWGPAFVDGSVALPNTTTNAKALHVWLEYDNARTKWACLGAASDI